MSILAMLSFCTSLFHKILAYFYIMTKIAFISIWTMSKCLKFIAGFDFTSIMKIIASSSTFSVNKLFTDSIFGQLVWIGYNSLLWLIRRSLIQFIKVSYRSLQIVIKQIIGHNFKIKDYYASNL